MERVEESGGDERLGPYEGSGLNEDTLADSSEAESGQMCCERDAKVEANPKMGLVEILVDDDYVEGIRRVDSNICHHINTNMFLPLA